MEKRPKTIYFIIVWVWVVIDIPLHPVIEMGMKYDRARQELPGGLQLFSVAVAVLMVYVVPGLVRMKELPRKIALGLFYSGYFLPLFRLNEWLELLQKDWTFVFQAIFYVLINSLIIVYLSSAKYIALSKKFRKQKQEQKQEQEQTQE